MKNIRAASEQDDIHYGSHSSSRPIYIHRRKLPMTIRKEINEQKTSDSPILGNAMMNPMVPGVHRIHRAGRFLWHYFFFDFFAFFFAGILVSVKIDSRSHLKLFAFWFCISNPAIIECSDLKLFIGFRNPEVALVQLTIRAFTRIKSGGLA